MMMILLTVFGTLLLTLHDVHSSVKHAECRIVYDKFHRQEMASRTFMEGEKWPKNEVPYVISSGYSDSDLSVITSAIEEIQKKSCVKWVLRTNEKNYVRISHEKEGCFAVLGYNRHRGEHILNLQKSDGYSTCMIKGIAAHEMLHILGFAHEQTRPDRDEYVTIVWENIQKYALFNFFRSIDVKTNERPPVCNPRSTQGSFDNCYSGFKTQTFGLEYDYGSIMHYGLRAFTKNGKATIRALKTVPAGSVIGNRRHLTELDARKLQAQYCNSEPEITTTRKPSVECRDRYQQCPQYKQYCDSHESVKNFCKVSCGICTECFDMYQNCPSLKQYCGQNDQINKGCKLSCGTC